MNKPYDQDFFKNPFGEGLIQTLEEEGNLPEMPNSPKLNGDVISMINKLSSVINNKKSVLLSEEPNLDLEVIDENLTVDDIALSEDDE